MTAEYYLDDNSLPLRKIKEGQIWYREEHDDLLLIIDGDGLVKQYWWVDFGLTVLNIFDEETISEMVYIGEFE